MGIDADLGNGHADINKAEIDITLSAGGNRDSTKSERAILAALWIVRLPLSLGAAVGLVTVFGITLRNGLMLLSHYRHLVTQEGSAWSGQTAARGAVERVVPVLLTAVVTALGLLPLAIGTGLPGQEIEGPMAIVILGGLISSTPLTLLALPGLASLLLRSKDFAGPREVA